MQEILVLSNVRKRYGGAVALDGVSFSLRPGEIHALVGENGAGKSTLIKILTGIVDRDDGIIRLYGEPYRPGAPSDAKHLGIQVVHQEFSLLPHLSIAENICFEDIPRNRFGWIDYRTLYSKSRAALAAVGLSDIDVSRPVEQLGVAHQQLVEIARALMSDSRILILDEPTATLTERETKRLFEIVLRLKSEGVAVVFVSHHFNEIFSICDRATVLRNGKSVLTIPIAQTSPDDLVSNMVGRQLAATMADSHQASSPSGIALSVDDWRPAALSKTRGLSLCIGYGEIVGIAGLVGSGRTELLRSIFAVDQVISGQMLRDGQPRKYRSPKDAIADGIGFVTEDRKTEGLILDMPIASNISLACLKNVSRLKFLKGESERTLTRRMGEEIKLKYNLPTDPASTLSGGNQQKVVLAKWLATKPQILLLDEPTRGIDVGAKAEIYTLLRNLAQQGLALLVVSSELPELMTLCDRILVMSKQNIAGELSRKDFSKERILQLAYAEEGRA